MRTSSLACSCLLFVSACDCSQTAVQFPPAPEADERLTLSTPRKDYLLGEPVQLELCFRNVSKDAVKVVETFPDAPLWISNRGDAFQRFLRNTTTASRDPVVVSLQPGEGLTYHYRVVLDRPAHERKMVFAQPGDYRVYAEFPLWLLGAQRTVAITSNVLQMRVKQPEGEDAQVWEQLKDPSFLMVLPNGGVLEDRKDVPMKMAKLLRSYPTSGYAVALRHALAKTYFRRRLDLADKDQELLAQSLDITHVEALADDRLDARGKEVLGMEMPLDKGLVALSKLGVPLDAAPELRTKKVKVIDPDYTLRLNMRSLSDELEASWQRRGDGYFLVPFDAASSKRPKGKGD